MRSGYCTRLVPTSRSRQAPPSPVHTGPRCARLSALLHPPPSASQWRLHLQLRHWAPSLGFMPQRVSAASVFHRSQSDSMGVDRNDRTRPHQFQLSLLHLLRLWRCAHFLPCLTIGPLTHSYSVRRLPNSRLCPVESNPCEPDRQQANPLSNPLERPWFPCNVYRASIMRGSPRRVLYTIVSCLRKRLRHFPPPNVSPGHPRLQPSS